MIEPPTLPDPSTVSSAVPARAGSGSGPRIGPLRITPLVVLVAIVLIGSLVFIGFVTINVHDNQIPLLAVGFVAFGASWAAIAVGALVGMWRAASYAMTGKAVGLALIGGLAGLGAIGCFAITALLTLVWNT